MAERLAALGIKAPTKPGETTQQRIEREKAERATKLRQAEEEDAKRETERQARINEEQGIPPPAPIPAPAPAEPQGAKRPPPPPSRKTAKSDASERKAQEEQRVLEEQKAQILATADLEYVVHSPQKQIIILIKSGMRPHVKRLSSKRNVKHLQHVLKRLRSKSRLVKSRKKKRSAVRRQLRQKRSRRKLDLRLSVLRSKLPKLGKENYRDSWRPLITRIQVMRKDRKKPHPKPRHLLRGVKNFQKVKRLSEKKYRFQLLQCRLLCHLFLHRLSIPACRSQVPILKRRILSSNASVRRQVDPLHRLLNQITLSTVYLPLKKLQVWLPKCPLSQLLDVPLVLAEMKKTTGLWSTRTKRNLPTKKAQAPEVPASSRLFSLERWDRHEICRLLVQGQLLPLLHQQVDPRRLRLHPQCRA
jgi:hypothetical protein